MEDFWPQLPEASGVTEPPVDESETRITPATWAQDVLWAADRINLKTLHTNHKKGRPPSTIPPGVSVSRFALWEFGKDNPKEMMGNLVIKALAIVQKNTSRDDDEDLQAAEEKSVGDMRKILAAALVEAASK